MPTPSIVIPVYDDPGYLDGAIRSVLQQTVDSWEAIVVDDGSPADTAEQVVAALGDSRVRLLRHDRNRGLAAARNTGIRGARGDVIVTLDADDELDPRYLETLLPLVANGSPFNVAFPDFVTFGALVRTLPWGHDDLSVLLRRQIIPGPGVTFRRSLWEAVGGYWEDDRLRAGNEDRDFWISALEVDLRPAHVPTPLYRYRIGHASMMTRLDAVAWRTHEAIYRRHRAIYDQHGTARAFLADGYVKSARAVRAGGDRRGALRLAALALRQQPWRFDALGVIGRAVLPAAVHRRLRLLRNGHGRNAT